MRNKKRIIFTIVMLLLLCLCYEASNDIMEMKSAMSKEQGSIGDRVNLVIEYGGSNEWSLPELADSASGHGRLEISGNGI